MKDKNLDSRFNEYDGGGSTNDWHIIDHTEAYSLDKSVIVATAVFKWLASEA